MDALAQFNVATAFAVLGRRDEAVRWLQQTADNGMPAYELFVNDPHLASLKGHAGYLSLLQRERPSYEARKAVYDRWSRYTSQLPRQ
jgi:hypothetical protein